MIVPWVQPAIVRLVVALCAWAWATAGTCQESWLFSPYQIRVWVALDPAAGLPGRVVTAIERAVVQQAGLVVGSAWKCQVEPAPAPLEVDMVRGLDRVPQERLRNVVDALPAPHPDKVMLVAVRIVDGSPQVAVREWDRRTQVWGPTWMRTCPQVALLERYCAEGVLASFAPLARIDDVVGSKAVIRFRAAGIIAEENSAVMIRPEQVLSPVIRYNDRYGKPRPDGIRVVEWTLLVVRDPNPLRTECEVLTINRAYLGGRASSRMERYALGVRVPFPNTVLELRSRDEPPRALAGYEIYAKDPRSGDTQLVGQTDWQGRLTIPFTEGQVRVFYVRSGGTLLARLPLVPGQTDVAVARLVDDTKRLHAEALVRSLHATVIDLIAQRELLAARVRAMIRDGKFNEAQRYLDQLRALPSVNEIRQRIDQGRQETVTTNPKIQALIDKMFLDIQNFVVQRIDPTLVDKLSTELSRAMRRGSS